METEYEVEKGGQPGAVRNAGDDDGGLRKGREAAVANTEINTEEETILEQALNGQVKSHSSKTGKEETVYVLADAQGGVNQVIVSSWVKNGEEATRFRI